MIVVVLFGGRGKISELMGDVAKGIKTFKKGMAEDEAKAERSRRRSITIRRANVVSERAEKKTKVG